MVQHDLLYSVLTSQSCTVGLLYPDLYFEKLGSFAKKERLYLPLLLMVGLMIFFF